MMSERETLARTIYGEARGEGMIGMEAVANVVMNRVARARWWGHTIESCSTHPFQFSCWNQDDPNREKLLAATEDDPQFKMALAIADRAIAGELTDHTHGADSYYASGTPRPRWALGLTPTTMIGRHIFYRTANDPAPRG